MFIIFSVDYFITRNQLLGRSPLTPSQVDKPTRDGSAGKVHLGTVVNPNYDLCFEKHENHDKRLKGEINSSIPTLEMSKVGRIYK